MTKNTTTIERALTKTAQPIANRLIVRCGSLKRVLSAGVLALDKLGAEEREELMALAAGITSELTPKNSLHNALEMIKEMTEVEKQQPGTVFRVLSRDEQKILDEFRLLITPKKRQTTKKKGG